MKYFDKDFFKFTLGFLSIVSLSLLIIAAVSAYATSISQISFKTSEQTIKPGELSKPITIQTQDTLGTSLQTTETIDLEFTSNSPTGEFLGSTGKSASKVTMSKNTANRTVYYRDSTEGTFVLTVNAKGRVSNTEWSASQSITITSSTSDSASPPSPAPVPLTAPAPAPQPEPKIESQAQESNKASFPTSSTLSPVPAATEIKQEVKQKEAPKKSETQPAAVAVSQDGEKIISPALSASTSSEILYEEPIEKSWWGRLWSFIRSIFGA